MNEYNAAETIVLGLGTKRYSIVCNMKNLILIGMPGAGKSTIGRLAADMLQMTFIDTDDLIESRTGLKLSEIIAAKGLDEFLKIEEQTILSLNFDRHVIATGGSVVYSDDAMSHLKSIGGVCRLDISLAELESRIGGALEKRGVAGAVNKSLGDLYDERLPLYKKYSDFTLRTDTGSKNDTARELAEWWLYKKQNPDA